MHTDTSRKPRPLLKALLAVGASLFLAAFGLGVYHSILTQAQLPGIHFSPWWTQITTAAVTRAPQATPNAVFRWPFHVKLSR